MTTQKTSNEYLNDLKLVLPFEASYLMDYEDAIVKKQGNSLTIGYLADDDSGRDNPLVDFCGYGNIYSAHRHSDSHREMQDALALNGDWDADLDLIEPPQLRKAWIDAAAQSDEFKQWANETAGAQARLDEPYYKRRAQKLWRETAGEYIYNEDCIYSFSFTDDVRHEVWKDLRAAGEIGTKGSVLLDCYEHSGQHWSISGTGMQCRWDTSSGAGVWVPDDNEAVERLDELSHIYAFGEIRDNGNWTRGSGKKTYQAVLDEQFHDGVTSSQLFAEHSQAFEWLKEKAEKLSLPRSQAGKDKRLMIGQKRASVEMAGHALELYNNWVSGQVFGVVVAVFNNAGTQDDPVWELEDSDECWGYYGSEWAVEALQDEFAEQQAA